MPIALITGASSGLGKEYIEAIIARYPQIDEFWLIARRKEKLEEIAKKHPDKVIAAISLDLQEDKSFALLDRLLREKSPEIKVLINAAGYGVYAGFYASDRQKQAGMVALNCTALTQITRLCLPHMADSSLIVNAASVAAFLPMPGMTVYAATKAYVLSFSKALREELRTRGINVIVVCPGPMDTEFFDVAYQSAGTSKLMDSMPRVSPKEVAEVSLRRGVKRKAMYTRGMPYKFYHVLTKIIPHNWLIKFIQV